MSKILWCGGSHLANALPHIEAAHAAELKAFEPDFYVTAGPRNRDWSGAGGRYTVKDSTVSGNAHEPEREIDLKSCDAIVFIGQFIQPFKAFIDANQPSSAVVERTLRDLPLKGSFHDQTRGIKHQWYNEPLEIFPPLANGPSFVVPDPTPAGARYAAVPLELKQKYADRITEFCNASGLVHVPTPEELLMPEGTTKAHYTLPGDALHMNAAYWSVVFETALIPALQSAL